jgi:hypothetical protein
MTNLVFQLYILSTFVTIPHCSTSNYIASLSSCRHAAAVSPSLFQSFSDYAFIILSINTGVTAFELD